MANVVEILITAKNLTGPTMAAVNAEVNKAGKGMAAFHKTAMLAGAGLVAVGVESVKMAAKFDSEMTLLQTQAGVSADKIDGLKKGVLDLAGKVGQDPDSLAEALFHVESNFASMGISSAKALKLTETAAKGATVGHADLVDVTNALTAAVASGIPGVENLDQAMGVLNATVGSGDMKMQDLASAFGSGMVATVKGFGLSITDVGAALATFGDNNIRGALAGNQLRMSVMALAKPIAGGADALKSIGLQTDTLAKDMQKGGLKLALEDLVAHMQAAGVSSQEQGQVITDAFGRKAGAGLNILVDQIGRFESKIPEIKDGAENFSQAWADTTKTFAFQMKSMQTGLEALAIGFGEKLIPPIQATIGFLQSNRSAAIGATEALGGLLAVTVAVSAAMKVAAGAKLAWAGITGGALAAKGAMETVALKAMYMRDASIAAGRGIKGLGAAFGALSTGAKAGLALAAVAGLVILVAKLNASNKEARVSTDDLARSLENGASRGKIISPVLDDLRRAQQGLVKDTDASAGMLDKISYSFTHWGAKFSSSASSAKAAANDYRDLGNAVGQIAKNESVDEAAKALEMLAQQGTEIPTKYLKEYTAAQADAAVHSAILAAAEGRYGEVAEKVTADNQAQTDVLKGLKDSYIALDQIFLDTFDTETRMAEASDKLTESFKKNGETLDANTEKGRDNRDAVSAFVKATDDRIAAMTKAKDSDEAVDKVWAKQVETLSARRQAMGKNKEESDKWAASILHIPKTVKIQANIDDLTAKRNKMVRELKTATGPRKVKLDADKSAADAKIAKLQMELDNLHGKTIDIVATLTTTGVVSHEGGGYASGGRVSGPGSGTSDEVPIWASNGEFVVNADAARKNRRLLEAINKGGHGVAAFAKGGRVSKEQAGAERQARGDAAGQLTISAYGQMAGYKTSSFTKSAGAPGDIGSLVGTLNEWRARIKAATHGATESRLVKALANFGAAALKNERALEKVNSQLDGAKSKLANLKDSFAQLRDGIASSVVSFGSIAKQGGAGPLGKISVAEQLRNSVGQAQEFAADLARLKKMGLNAQSLSEIAQAGIEGGGLETANRLLGSSPDQIKQINDLEKQLIAAGKAAGTSTADAMYGGGIKAAEGMVKGLEKEQHRIEKVMAAAAQAMANQLKKAFGIGRKASGGVVGAAASGGNRWGRTLVGEYAPEIVDLPIGSRVHSGPDTQRMLAGGGGGRVPPIEITLMIGDTDLGTVLVDPLSRVIRNRGGNVQAVLGVRGK